jgi:hypothetical protein
MLLQQFNPPGSGTVVKPIPTRGSSGMAVSLCLGVTFMVWLDGIMTEIKQGVFSFLWFFLL